MDDTLKVLGEIRDAVRDVGSRVNETNERLDRTNERLDRTNQRLDRTNDRLDTFQASTERQFEALERTTGELFDAAIRKATEVELRLSTGLMEVATTLGTLRDLYADRLDVRSRVERCELAIDELRQRKS